MFGLYDTDGILRFISGDREACMGYAELFELNLAGCSVMALPEDVPIDSPFRNQRRRRWARYSS